ncbi:MAG: CoA pyrophosphatase [Eubacterium sp.]|nr:CoA pyrophosphatase [Eubacterium sp.]
MKEKLSLLRENLAGHHVERIQPPHAKPSAVLIPLLETEAGISILFEKRSADVRQGGEICFPGGRIEKTERPAETSVRETSEELLIPEEQIEVIAPMHCMPGPGGGDVTSVLGILHDYHGTYAEAEVAEVFTIPLSWFAEHPPLIHKARMQAELNEDFPYHLIPGGRSYPMRSIPRRFYFYETEHGVIWGMTAELLFHFLQEIL